MTWHSMHRSVRGVWQMGHDSLMFLPNFQMPIGIHFFSLTEMAGAEELPATAAGGVDEDEDGAADICLKHAAQHNDKRDRSLRFGNERSTKK